MEELRVRYNISILIFFMFDELWARICGHIYVAMGDMHRMRDAILELMEEDPTKKKDTGHSKEQKSATPSKTQTASATAQQKPATPTKTNKASTAAQQKPATPTRVKKI